MGEARFFLGAVFRPLMGSTFKRGGPRLFCPLRLLGLEPDSGQGNLHDGLPPPHTAREPAGATAEAASNGIEPIADPFRRMLPDHRVSYEGYGTRRF